MSNKRSASGYGSGTRRLTTETKASTKTTEFFAYVGVTIAIIIASIVVGDGESANGDAFTANDAMRYITYLTIGYMIARGLAKSGAREPYDESRDDAS
jgi:fucose permease